VIFTAMATALLVGGGGTDRFPLSSSSLRAFSAATLGPISVVLRSLAGHER
jgi:hypothetical protein